MSVFRRPKKHRRWLWGIALLLTAVIVFFEIRLKPVTASAAEIQAQALAAELISSSVSEVLEEIDNSTEKAEIITYSREGTVTSIHANAALTNRIKTRVTLKIQEELSEVQNRRMDIPLGTILGSDLFSGTGPQIPLSLSLSGSIRSDFDSVLESGGINQTVHKLFLHITADITVLMPLHSFKTTVHTSVLISETVIVGTVPAFTYPAAGLSSS